jgi:3-oxoacyl-[acyl-carrier-protein] synthase III
MTLRMGIRERRNAAEGPSNFRFSLNAFRHVLDKAGVEADELDRPDQSKEDIIHGRKNGSWR